MQGRAIGKRVEHFCEQPGRIHRRAQVPHVSGEHFVEFVEKPAIASFCRERRLLRLPNLISHLAVEAVPHAGLELEHHRHFVLPARHVGKLPAFVPKLHVRAARASREISGGGDQRSGRGFRIGSDPAIVQERE
jgi:hypothetical protein